MVRGPRQAHPGRRPIRRLSPTACGTAARRISACRTAADPTPSRAAEPEPDAGYAYMWHSHNEREITTNNVFPGGMMMMLIIDPPRAAIDELQ